jgi:cytochrome P450 family 110
MLLEKDRHASVREAIMPMFNNGVVHDRATMIAEIVDREVCSWPTGEAVSFGPYLDRLTLKTILMTAIDIWEPMQDELCQRMLKMLSVMSTPLLQVPRLRRLPGWRGTWRRFMHHRRAVDELVYRLIARRREEIVDSAQENDHDDDLLDLLIAARNPDGSQLSDKQVRDNLVSTIIAGHETTAVTLAWMLQLLAANLTVQGHLFEEIDCRSEQANDDQGRIVDLPGNEGDRPAGTYMNAVIREAMRHRPAFLFLPPRVVLRQTELGGWSYQPPSQLVACTYLLHHDPELYRCPYSFLPERFLEGSPQPGTLLPWGLGRKRCPGRQLALITIRQVLRRILSRSLVLPASTRLARPHWRTALLTPDPGSRLILRCRSAPRPCASRAGRVSI